MSGPAASRRHRAFVDEIPWLAGLRPDEREHASNHFRCIELATGSQTLPAGEDPRMGIVVAGEITVRSAELPGLPANGVRLSAGDRFGELAIFEGVSTAVELVASAPATVALLDGAGFRGIAERFPIVWTEVARRLSLELAWKNDLLREIQEFETDRAGSGSLELFLQAKRKRLARRKTGITRSAAHSVARRLLLEPSRDPAFWILTGFLGAIAVSRAVVAAILRFGLEARLFSLRSSGGTNPIHTHHFNYGFALLVTTGLLAFVPRSRRFLRPLAGLFGFGLGLVFDEFALIWNLNPDYYSALNYEAQTALGVVLLGVVYFRRPGAALFERMAGGFRSRTR